MIADVRITTPGFVTAAVLAGLVLVVAALLVAGRAAGRSVLRRRVTRTVAALVLAVVLVVEVAIGVNARFDYLRTVGDVVGLAPADQAALAQVLLRRTRPDQGLVATIAPSATVSRFAARPGRVYLPPAWFVRPRPRLPVLMLLHGTPGFPQDWLDGGQAAATADAYAAAHHGLAPILVVPDINGAPDADSECLDGRLGRVETYLGVDVPRYVERMFHSRRPGAGWAVGGLSEGGTCAAMLALRHPGTFPTFVDISGLAGPRLGETNGGVAATVAAMFDGSARAFAEHEPADLLRAHRYPGLAGWFESGDADPAPAAAATALAGQARRAGMVSCLVLVPGGGHSFDVFAQGLQDAFGWVSGRLGLAPAPPDPRCH